jgi:hypothetical protein
LDILEKDSDRGVIGKASSHHLEIETGISVVHARAPIQGVKSGRRREVRHLTRERIQQTDGIGDPVAQDEEALDGGRAHVVAAELREVRPDALARGDVEEAAAVRVGDFFREHDPSAREEAAVQDAVRARVRRAPPPRAAHGAEADVVGHVVGEKTLGDHPRRPVHEIGPVHPASAAAEVRFN